MYLRTTKRRNKDGRIVEYYQLAETLWNRERKRPEISVVHNFGRADLIDKEALRRLARSIERVANDGIEVPKEVTPTGERIQIEWSRPYGGIYAARELWKKLGIAEVLRNLCSRKRRRAPHETAIFAMVANRLLEPVSKLACHERWLPGKVYFPEAEELTLDQLYFAMDFLEDHIGEIEQEVFHRTMDLFNADVDLIFWDTTTIHFEIDEDDAFGERHHGREYPALRKRGKGKGDHDHQPQALVGLALTRDGLPVRSWVFPGNTMDATTIKQVKKELRLWKLNRCILVGDAGMDSKENRKELSAGLGRYILAMPVGKIKEVHQEVLARPGRYRKVSDSLEVKEVTIGEGERRRRYIVCRNLAEAQRQRRHREQVLKELRLELKKIEKGKKEHPKRACELMASGRYGKYLSKSKKGRIQIDPEKVKKAKRMDGRYVLLTNDDSLDPEDVGSGYKAMMIIESCFRRMKTTGLRIRPVYHWTPHRIISHVKLCVLSLLLQRAAEIRCGDTWRNIRDVLESVQAVCYRMGGKTIVQTSRPGNNAKRCLVTLGIPTPKRVLSITETSK